MEKRKKHRIGSLLIPILAISALLVFCLAVWNVNAAAQEKGSEHLEQALRQATVACYAAEGIYPPNPAYLQEHYGVQIDRERYVVYYEIFADNLMPVITVLEKEP